MNNKNTAHIMMQSKGGVGKSMFSSILAQYLREKNKVLKIISTGPVHYTLENYTALNVSKIETLNKNKRVDQSNFDATFNDFFTENFSMLIDTSSNDFLDFNDYMINDVISDAFLDQNKQLVIHCPISYGQNKNETISCLLRIIKDYPNTPIIIWENEFFGKNKNIFIHPSIFNDTNNIIGAVKLESMDNDMEKQAFFKMLENFLIFSQIGKSNKFTYIEKEILECIKHSIWQQLDFIFDKNVQYIN